MCPQWIESVLHELGGSGPTGRILVEEFFAYDEAVRRSQRQVPRGPCRARSGLTIVIAKPFPPGAGASALFSDTLMIDPWFVGRDAGTLVFGHEVSHYTQGIHRLSVQGEVLARYVEQQLRSDLGVDPSWSHAETLYLSQRNPFSLLDLRVAKAYLFERSAGYLVVPLRIGGGLNDVWLTRLAIRLPVPPAPEDSIPTPLPVPTPPPPRTTPVPPG